MAKDLRADAEDFRAEIVPYVGAVSSLDDGLIEAGPAVVLPRWFARHRDRLRSEAPKEPSRCA